VKLGTCIADAVTGIHMAYAISSALYYREKSGLGQYIDVAMMDTVFSTLENFVVMKTHAGITSGREGNSNIGAASFNVYTSKDSYVAIAIANDTLFSKFAHALKREDLLETDMYRGNKSRKENEEMLNSIINEWAADKTTKEICEIMDEVGVPVGPILGMDELVEDPQIRERDMLVEINHPTEGKFICPGNPIKYSLSSISQFQPAPLLGANSGQLLREYGGYTSEEIKKFQKDGII
jgi:CoA:oxalate CoA-transferase